VTDKTQKPSNSHSSISLENLCKILPEGVTSKKETGQRITLRNMVSWRRDEPAKKYEAEFLKKNVMLLEGVHTTVG
jgi:hypothetical protein